MNRKHALLSLIAFASLTLGLAACGGTGTGGESRPDALPKKTYTQSRKTKGGTDFLGKDWIYFSFETGQEVPGIDESNYTSRTDWDLAIHGRNFRTNSGTSGEGKGGALMTNKTKLSEVTEAPTGDYTVDDEITVSGFIGRVISVKVPGNKALTKLVGFQGPPPVFTPSDKVFIIRTASGKYAKLRMIGYINDEGKSGYVSFEYVYQPSGSTKF